jgi:hypothetical protein
MNNISYQYAFIVDIIDLSLMDIITYNSDCGTVQGQIIEIDLESKQIVVSTKIGTYFALQNIFLHDIQNQITNRYTIGSLIHVIGYFEDIFLLTDICKASQYMRSDFVIIVLSLNTHKKYRCLLGNYSELLFHQGEMKTFKTKLIRPVYQEYHIPLELEGLFL